MNTFLTFVIVVLTVLIWRTYTRLNWLTGAQESHSNLMLQLQALDQDIELVWWDSVEHGPPPIKAEHGAQRTIEKIYVGLPEHQRRMRTWRDSVAHWLGGGQWIDPTP